MITNEIDLEKMVKDAQQSCNLIQDAITLVNLHKMKEALTRLDSKSKKEYTRGVTSLKIINGILCRFDPTRRIPRKTVYQMIIPRNAKSLQLEILRLSHDIPDAGHFGHKKTYTRIKDRYFWPGLYSDSKKYVSSCPECQLHKPNAPIAINRPLNPSLPNGPLDRLGIDLVVDLPTTCEDYRHICTITDMFTKYAVAVPLRSKQAVEVADAIFNHWYMVYGIPYEIITDQGKEFDNELLQRLNERLSVGQKRTTPYYPQSNGQAESFNKIIKKSLSIYCEKNPTDWTYYLIACMFAYNTSLHTLTGFSPFFLMFGREPRLPMDVLMSNNTELSIDQHTYQLESTTMLKEAYQIVRENILRNATATQQAWKEKLRYHHQFQIGDKVSIFKPKLAITDGEIPHSQVWKASWLGPFKVVAKPFANSDIYTLEDDDSKRQWKMNVHKMRPFIERQYLNPSLDDPTSETDSSLNRRSDVDTPPSLPLDASGLREADAVNPLLSSVENSRQLLTSNNRKLKRKRRVDTSLLKDGEIDLTRYTFVKIKDHKTKGRQVLYLTEWADPNVEDTWEPKEHFGVRSQQWHALVEYWDNQPTHIRRPRWYIIMKKKKNFSETLMNVA
jgi:transposase InsO family protein